MKYDKNPSAVVVECNCVNEIDKIVLIYAYLKPAFFPYYIPYNKQFMDRIHRDALISISKLNKRSSKQYVISSIKPAYVFTIYEFTQLFNNYRLNQTRVIGRNIEDMKYNR